MTQNRDFKGVWIPKAVWLDSRLSALDKVILTEIDSLDQGERGCFASNKHIADFCQCSERKVSESVSQLIKCGYLRVQNFDGRQRELRSRLAEFTRQTSKKCEADTQNLRHSNTSNKPSNNTSNKKNIKKRSFTPPTLEEVEKYCKERKNNVDAKKFFDYFSAADWVDSKGNPVKNWKQKVITWESFGKDDNDGRTKQDTGSSRKYGNYI